MNTSSPHVAKSRDLVADFKKGIKQDPSLFPSLKHIDNWPTFKRETMSTYLTQSTNHGAVRRMIYLRYSFTMSMQSSAPILRLTLDESWFGTMSHRKMRRRSGRSYPMIQKSLRLPNSMQPIYYSTLIQPEWRTGKALCFHSFSITKSRFGYTTSYNP
jgi:hypothetical protein